MVDVCSTAPANHDGSTDTVLHSSQLTPRRSLWCADPRVAEDQQVILSKLENCEFDAIFDVRSQDYYDNWRLSGGEHLPDASRFDASRLAAENITSVAFYCWNAPWQSEPAAQWFASQYGDQGVAVYDSRA